MDGSWQVPGAAAQLFVVGGTPLLHAWLRFSLLPRSHGECGWAKYTGSPVAVIVACCAISEPQSQVNDRRICAGSPPVAAMTASPTVRESRPVNGTRMRKRDIR